MTTQRIHKAAYGWVRDTYWDSGKLWFSTPVDEVPCQDCAGTGRVETDLNPWRTVEIECDECHGAGTVWVDVEEEEIELSEAVE